jgi:hypothetical protein
MPTDRKLALEYLLPLLLILVPLIGVVQALDHSSRLDHYIFIRKQAFWRSRHDRCSLSGHFATTTDRLLLDDAFRPDFPRKRVYLIGGCQMEELLNTTLVQRATPRLGIYGMPGYNYLDLEKLVDWFTGSLGLGRAGNRPNLILVGLTMDMTEPPDTPSPADYFITTDLYQYDAGGIRLKPMNPARRFYLLHRERYAQVLQALLRLRPHLITRVAPTCFAPEMDTTQVPQQLDALRRILRKLKATGAAVEGVVTPNASWLETPARIRVRAAMEAICREEGVRVLDLARTVPDPDFLDQDHLSYEGQQATHPRVLAAITPYL